MKKPPNIKVYPEDKLVSSDAPEFLTLNRQWYRISYPDGSTSKSFLHDSVNRRCLDASVMVAHCIISGTRFLYLRSAVRPAIMQRFPDEGNLWELPAGLIEPGESPEDAAARETEEELGFSYSADKFKALGEYIFPAVGILPERIYFFEIKVDSYLKKEPALDGSPLENGGEVELVSLSFASRLIKEGFFKDAKTELGIRRFIEKYR